VGQGCWREIVEGDCRARGLGREDAMDRVGWMGGWETINRCEWGMFLLVPAHPDCPGQNPQRRKMVVCVCVFIQS